MLDYRVKVWARESEVGLGKCARGWTSLEARTTELGAALRS